MRLSSNTPVSTKLEINGVEVGFIDTVTMRGLETVASVLGAPFTLDKAWMPFIALGQGETSPSTEDRSLENEKWRKEGAVTVTRNAYIVEATFGVDEPTSAYILREAGLLDERYGGVLGARWVTTEDINVAVDDTVRVVCTIYVT